MFKFANQMRPLLPSTTGKRLDANMEEAAHEAATAPASKTKYDMSTPAAILAVST